MNSKTRLWSCVRNKVITIYDTLCLNTIPISLCIMLFTIVLSLKCEKKVEIPEESMATITQSYTSMSSASEAATFLTIPESLESLDSEPTPTSTIIAPLANLPPMSTETSSSYIGSGSLEDVENSTGILMLSEAKEVSKYIGDQGPKMATNKAMVLAALKSNGATEREIAIAIAMAFQETAHMAASEGDHTKSGLSANYGLFNLNGELIKAIDPTIEPTSMNADSAEAVDISVKLVLMGLRKSTDGWQPINSMLNFVRAGSNGLKSTGQANCSYDCQGYRNSIAAMAYLIMNPTYTTKLTTGSTRINNPLKYQ